MSDPFDFSYKPRDMDSELLEFARVREVLSEEMRGRGWIVDSRTDQFGIIGTRKSGKPYAGHRVRLQLYLKRSEPHPDAIADPETGEILPSSNDRIWRVKSNHGHRKDSRDMGGGYFRSLSEALAVFREEATLTAPFDI